MSVLATRFLERVQPYTKVRLPNPSARRGKRGGFRVIYYLLLSDRVIMLTIYSKSLRADLSLSKLRRLLDEIDISKDDF